jgi:hypothetical protein
MSANDVLELLTATQALINQSLSDGPVLSQTGLSCNRPAGLTNDRRRSARLSWSRPVVVIPIRADFSLDFSRRSTGKTIDLSAGGIGIELEFGTAAIPTTLLLGVETPTGQMVFSGVEARSADSSAPLRKRIGARFGGPANRLLQRPLLTPTFDPQTMQYRSPLPPSVVSDWVDTGALAPRLLDRVLLCPCCESLPTFRNACRACKSGRVDRERLIHHYACAHVDRVEAFNRAGEVVCPKCLRRNLVVGADFEFQGGPMICLDCRWTDSEPVQVGHCLRCGSRFLAEQAKEQQLVGYDAQRLDVLAFLPAS